MIVSPRLYLIYLLHGEDNEVRLWLGPHVGRNRGWWNSVGQWLRQQVPTWSSFSPTEIYFLSSFPPPAEQRINEKRAICGRSACWEEQIVMERKNKRGNAIMEKIKMSEKGECEVRWCRTSWETARCQCLSRPALTLQGHMKTLSQGEWWGESLYKSDTHTKLCNQSYINSKVCLNSFS